MFPGSSFKVDTVVGVQEWGKKAGAGDERDKLEEREGG